MVLRPSSLSVGESGATPTATMRSEDEGLWRRGCQKAGVAPDSPAAPGSGLNLGAERSKWLQIVSLAGALA